MRVLDSELRGTRLVARIAETCGRAKLSLRMGLSLRVAQPINGLLFCVQGLCRAIRRPRGRIITVTAHSVPEYGEEIF